MWRFSKIVLLSLTCVLVVHLASSHPSSGSNSTSSSSNSTGSGGGGKGNKGETGGGGGNQGQGKGKGTGNPHNCVPTGPVDVGAPCAPLLTTPCLDTNAECAPIGCFDVCLCVAGYHFEVTEEGDFCNGTCEQNAGDLMDTCMSDADCTAGNTQCLAGYCQCVYGTTLTTDGCLVLPDGSVGSSGDCTLSGCYGNFTQCVVSTCVCIDGYTLAGVDCEPFGNELCDECDDTSCVYPKDCVEGICKCDAGFIEVDGECKVLTGGGGNCSFASCYGDNTLCVDGTCVCEVGYYEAEGAGCIIYETELCDVCDDDSNCDGNTVCVGGVCKCPATTMEFNGACYGSDYNDPCTTVIDSCTYLHGACGDDGSCGCEAGLEFDTTHQECYGSDLHEPCHTGGTVTCIGDNVDCIEGVCACTAGTVEVGGDCVNGDIGDDCIDNPNSCTGAYMECIGSKCQCADFYTEDTGVCYAHLGAPCSETGCFDVNAGCDILETDETTCEGLCSCNTGYVSDTLSACGGTCVAQMNINETCNPGILNICKDEGAICVSVDSTTSQCLCDVTLGFEYDAATVGCSPSEKQLNDTCACTDTCIPVETTYCLDDICVCRPGYTFSSEAGVCVPDNGIPIGGVCQGSPSCGQYPNTKCEFPDDAGSGKKNKVCQCDLDKGFTLNEATDVCECTVPGSICKN